MPVPANAARKIKPRKKSPLEELLAVQIRAEKLQIPMREYRFHAVRSWRFDFAWPGLKLAAEAEGGIYTNGRHVRGAGFEADMEKYNAAIVDGWDVVRFSAGMIRSGEAIKTLKILFNLKSEGPNKEVEKCR